MTITVAHVLILVTLLLAVGIALLVTQRDGWRRWFGLAYLVEGVALLFALTAPSAAGPVVAAIILVWFALQSLLLFALPRTTEGRGDPSATR